MLIRIFQLTLVMLAIATASSQVHAQVRQPMRLVQRPGQSVGYGFPQAGVTSGQVPSATYQRAQVRQVGYAAGSYGPQGSAVGDAIMGEMVSPPSAAEPVYMDTMPGEYLGDGMMMDSYSDEGYIVDGYGTEAIMEGDYFDGYASGGLLGWGSCGSGSCGDDCDPCPDCFWHGLGGLVSNADFRMGVHGFKNTANRQQDGSFGFHGGVNLGLPLKKLTCGLFSGSLGINSVQSNFAGSSFTEENRNQLFVTAALFRRVDQGLQGGIAYDFLREDWYANYGISQLRAELSWVTERQNTFGFRFMKGQASETTNSVFVNSTGGQTVLSETWTAARQYRLFFRKSIRGGEGYLEFNAGHTDEKHAILGLDINTPMRGAMRFYGGFTYLLPQESILSSTSGQETWNVAMGIQISPYRQRGHCRFNVPMFDVADNGTFQVIRQTN
jgi:hypothetical protein